MQLRGSDEREAIGEQRLNHPGGYSLTACFSLIADRCSLCVSRNGRPFLDPINGRRHATMPGAVRTTEELTIRLDTVANNPALAVRACGREDMNCALETVEDVRITITGPHLERFVVGVAAELAGFHPHIP
jgi:hypothetical protein